MIGAGAVLSPGTNVPPGSLVLGVPGRVVKVVDTAALQGIDLAWRHYVARLAAIGKASFPSRAIERPGMSRFEASTARDRTHGKVFGRRP